MTLRIKFLRSRSKTINNGSGMIASGTVAESRDYKQQLRASLVGDELAQQIYLAARRAYGMAVDAWDDLEIHEKNAYRELGIRVLQAVQPTAVEPHAAKIYRFCNRLARERERLS